jgi:predicted Zn-dependent protease
MIKSVDKGIFAVSFGGGQVDITSGKFVFNCTEAYEINNGKIGSPIKGATLIGDGPSILKEVSLVGNDMMLDPGIGTCGKAGQGVPVGVAQPSILIDKMTVGGTNYKYMVKDQEYLKSKASYCLDLAKKLGATDASVTVGNSISETVNFRNRKLDESNRSDSLGIVLKLILVKKNLQYHHQIY